jgi:Glycosyl transferase family 11
VIFQVGANSLAALLQGGLGNQLFIYAALLEQASRLGVDTQLVASGLPHGGYQLAGIADDVPIQIISDQSNRLIRRAAQVQRRVPALDRTSRLYTERNLAYESRIRRVRPRQLLVGYFQSAKYFPSVGSSIRLRMSRFEPSNSDFSRLSEKLGEHANSIAIHVRRGDYLTEANQKYHGVASAKYFRDGVAWLRSLGLDGPIWLFSDNPAQATQLLDFPGIRVLDPDLKLAPLETLLLLAKATGLVMSNSSFSWWAAWVANRPEFVVVPKPWFANGDNLEGDMVLPKWRHLPIV